MQISGKVAIFISSILIAGVSLYSVGYLLGDAKLSIQSSSTAYAADVRDIDFESESFPWLKDNGLTTMADATAFRPHDTITRGEAAKFLTNYAKLIGIEQTETQCEFSDTKDYDASLRSFTVESCKYGLFRGSAGKFLPKNTITEAQALAVISRSLYGMQNENMSPWYSEYYAIGQDIGLITSESLSSVNTTNITREKLGTWLYIASQVDDSDSSTGGDTIVYEADVDGPSDCTSYETYDSARKVCSFECTSEAECKSIQSQIDTELDGWSDDLAGEDRSAPTSEGEATSTNMNVAYSVSKGERITKVSGTDTTEYQSLWKEVADLSPDAFSDTYIESFEVYSDKSSDILAYVSDDDNNGKWKMSINLPTHKSSSDKEQKATLIHELSHIITLNKEQFMTANGKCPNYETQEGCTKSTAYLNTFVKKFWGTATTASYDATKFVTEYATSSPEEDIAESFAFFVLSSNFSDSTVKDQKMNFFNSYPELVKMRTEMRNVLSSEIVRARKATK